MSDWGVRVDGNVVEQVEIKGIRWGYAFPRSCDLFFPGDHDIGLDALTNDNLVEVSQDGFTTLVFKGYLQTNSPGGVSSEGVSYKIAGLEEATNRWIVKYNSSIDYTYNRDNLPDYSSPNDWGSSWKWTVGQIMVDVLEHAIGVPGGGSDISDHHPSSDSVTNVYMPPAVLLSYTAADLLALDLIVSEMRVTGRKFWDFMQSMVQMMDNHGIFIDPSDPSDPILVVHDFTTSVAVDFECGSGALSEHIEDVETSPGSPLVTNTEMSLDISPCKTKVIIEGRGKILELIPASLGGSANGTMVAHWDGTVPSEVGRKWIIQEPQLYTPFWEGALTGGLYGPILIVDGVPCYGEMATWDLDSGIATVDENISGSTVEVWTLFLGMFQVTAGYGGTAYDDHGLESEIAFYDDSLLETSTPHCLKYHLVSTLNPFTGVDCLSDNSEYSGEEYCLEMPVRDDTAIMQAIADAILARMGDEKIRVVATLDGIDLSTYTLLNSGNLANLNKWSSLETQIMEISIIPEKHQMVCSLTNDVFRMPGYAEWKRRFRLRSEMDYLSRVMDALRHPKLVGGKSQFSRM